MPPLLRHCLGLVALTAVLCLGAWLALDWGPARCLWAWGMASALLCAVRLALGGLGHLLRLLLRSY